MNKAQVLSLLGRKGQNIAGDYYRSKVKQAMVGRDWFSGGFERLVTDSVNHALESLGVSDRVYALKGNTANAIASKIDN